MAENILGNLLSCPGAGPTGPGGTGGTGGTGAARPGAIPIDDQFWGCTWLFLDGVPFFLLVILL